MFRSLFFAIGIFLLILGAQTLLVDRWILSGTNPLAPVISTDPSYYSGSSTPFRSAGYSNYPSNYDRSGGSTVTAKRVYQTREWMPWSLLAAGSIIVLYTYSTSKGSSSD